MPEWITKYWIEWIFGILCAILAGLYKSLSTKIKKQREEQDALKNGMRALLRRQIIEDCEDSIKQGFCPITRRETILDMYQCYHALGGNGAVTSVKEAMYKLPTIDPNEGKESTK